MAKGLLRTIVNFIGSKFRRSSSKVNLNGEGNSNPSLHGNSSSPVQRSNVAVGTTTIRDLKTGEYSQAEVLDQKEDYGIEKSNVGSDTQSLQMEKVKLRARNEAYLKAVKGLIAMKLDPDIFSDAMEELRKKYYGKDGLPDEVATIVENLTNNVHANQ